MVDPPTGTVTFLFTDIEGSTRLAQAYPEKWESLRVRHHSILYAAIESQNGYIFQDAGDSFCAAFHTAPEAITAALNAQRELQREPWEPAPIKVRMGIHTGAAQFSQDQLSGYMGYTTLALTNRIMSAGHGGQILVSGATRELARDTLPQSAELLDLGEQRLKDLLRPEHLSQLNSPGLQATFPPLKTLEAFPNNLPMQLTTFVGREKEIGKVKAELESHRLVTLTGSGGTGKTRLSLQVAADLLDQFEQGVWFVELAPLADPELIPQAILSAIGISGQAGKPPMEILKEYLHEKQILIVLDNCEHLIEASSRVANALLNSAPGLKILASSREALGVQGEVSFPVPSLSLPDPKHMPAIEQLSQFEAVRLFIDRALLVAAEFAVDKNNAPFIAQICYRLDGIPLAIELAAARTKMMSVEQISARLDDRFRLLTGGARTALPRQQTLRALIDWSYGLLTENERLLLRRLSVFVGGWTLDAAEEVCSGEGVEPYEILDLLSQLVNKSLVSVIECSSCNVMRYRMLETIRQYAREKLLETSGSESLHQRHLAYFRSLAEKAGPELFHSHQADWLDRLEIDLDNLRLALEWALDGDVGAGLKLMEASFPFWEARGSLRESCEWLGNLLEHYGEEDSLRARSLAVYAWWSGYMLDFNKARKAANEGLQLARAISDRQAEARCLLGLGVTTTIGGDMERGIQIVEQSKVIFQELEDLIGQASAALWLSLDHNDLERSKALVTESLRLFREIGHISGIANSLGELAMRTIWGGDFSTPLPWLEETRSLYRQLRDLTGESKTLYLYGILNYWQGDYGQACKYSNEAIAISERSGINFYVFWAGVTVAYATMRQGDLLKAKEMFAGFVQQCRKANDEIGLLFSLEGLSSLQFNRGLLQTAARLYGWTDARRVKIGNRRPPVEQASIGKEQGLLCSELGDEAFKALHAEGTTLTLDQAIALAQEV